MARRRYQRGCLFQRGRERKVWVLRFREDVMLPSGEISRVHRSEILGTLCDFPTRRMAQRLADQRLREFNQGGFRPQTTLTFRDYIETHWQPNLFPTFKFSTRQGYAYLLRKYLIPFFGDRQLPEITRQMVQAFVTQLGKHLAPKSVCLAKNVLSKVLSTAVEWGYVHTNPVPGVRLPTRQATREAVALGPEQVRKLVSVLPEPVAGMVLVDVLTGLRRGELFALRWNAVDFERKAIHVRESVYEGHFNTPKTRSSIRTIPMAEAVEAVFRRLLPANANANALVFHTAKGSPLRPDNVLKRVIHPACVKAELPKVGWHDLRHTSATLLHQHEPLRVAQAILGHSDLQTTLGYTHVLPNWQREAVERLEKGILFPDVPKTRSKPKEVSSLIQ